MSRPAARVYDLVLQDAAHCHATHPIPQGPNTVYIAIPHPPESLPIVGGAPTVLIGNQPAARVGDQTTDCTLSGCVPSGPGIIARGSATVLIEGKPAARLNDITSHPSCAGPIPGLTGKIISGLNTVLIGG